MLDWLIDIALWLIELQTVYIYVISKIQATWKQLLLTFDRLIPKRPASSAKLQELSINPMFALKMRDIIRSEHGFCTHSLIG